MTERKQVYRCNICGNIIEVLHAGAGTLVCCGKEMELLNEASVDEGAEKHVPVIEKTGNNVKVKVGSIKHPMEEKHYIEWIELISDDKVYRKFLKPGEEPEAEFEVESSGDVKAREYCTVHGLWGSSI